MDSVQARNVEQAFARFKDAMLAGDDEQLRSLTAPNFTLRHITGYVQSLGDWLQEMSLGQFIYYGIDVKSVSVTVGDGHAALVARTLTDAQVYGSRNVWRLQLEMNYVLEQGRWIAESAVASIW